MPSSAVLPVTHNFKKAWAHSEVDKTHLSYVLFLKVKITSNLLRQEIIHSQIQYKDPKNSSPVLDPQIKLKNRNQEGFFKQNQTYSKQSADGL